MEEEIILKDEQKEIVKILLEQNQNCYAELPTGFGKSFLARYFGNIGMKTLVISPLKSICWDQFNKLNNKGVKAEVINSDISSMVVSSILYDYLLDSSFNHIFITPESYLKYRTEINKVVDIIILDECDSAIEYKSYRPKILECFKIIISSNIKFLCITATHNPDFFKLVLRENISIFRHLKPRKNIYLKSIKLKHPSKEILAKFLDKCTPTIVYCDHIQTCELLSDYFSTKIGLACNVFHGKLTKSNKDKVLSNFMSNNLNVVFATSALSRGFDKNNLTKVILYNTVFDKNKYIQFCGRAGRKEQISEAIHFINLSDIYRDARTRSLENALSDVDAILALDFI